MKLNSVKIFIATLVCFLIIASCKQIDLHEQNITIPQNKWQSNFICTNTFEIKDTNVIYNVYIVIRHTDAYEYNNIWLNVGLQQVGETMKYQKLNLSLANDAKGWEGIGMNDIWEVRKPIARVALKKGAYVTSVVHIMRQNPLQNIMNVGVRVEKEAP
jgi:gliding motility-associated lipoprotein GldH